MLRMEGPRPPRRAVRLLDSLTPVSLNRLVDSQDLFYGSSCFIFQTVPVQQNPDASSPVLNVKEEEVVSVKKKRKLTEGGSSESPVLRPPGSKPLPAGVSWTRSKIEVIGYFSLSFFFSMNLLFSSTVLFCSGFFLR